MKNILIIGLAIVLGLMYGCRKQDAVKPLGELVKLTVKAIAPSDTLQLLKEGKVFYETGGFETQATISVSENGTEVQIRKKGETQIRATRMILPNAFEQTIEIIYEDGKVYEKFVNVKITGYKPGGVLELFLDGRFVPSVGMDEYGPALPSEVKVPVEAGQNRLLEIRKAGGTAVIASYAVVADKENQEFKFYFDGEKNISSMDVGPLSDPQKMLLMAKFTSTVSIYTGPADLVVFLEEGAGSTYTGFRMELPEDGSYGKTVELPALPPAPARANYMGYVVKRGTTNVLPYHTANELLPIKPIPRFYITFTAGAAAIFSLKDEKRVLERPTSLKGTTFSILGVDIAKYIKQINFK